MRREDCKVLALAEPLEIVPDSGLALRRVVFQAVNQSGYQRAAGGINGHPDRDLDRVQPDMQNVEMRIERAGQAQSRRERDGIAVLSIYRNENGFDHSQPPGG